MRKLVAVVRIFLLVCGPAVPVAKAEGSRNYWTKTYGGSNRMWFTLLQLLLRVVLLLQVTLKALVRVVTASVSLSDAEVGVSDAVIQDSKAIVRDTNAQMITLWLSKGTLEISSEPSGTRIFINGTHVGKTPLNLTLDQELTP